MELIEYKITNQPRQTEREEEQYHWKHNKQLVEEQQDVKPTERKE